MTEGQTDATISELEAYMGGKEALYFALYPDPKSGPRLNWSGYRNYIAQVKGGVVPDTTPETSTRRAADHLLGLRRLFGEAIHPRKTIRKRQVATLAAFAATLPAASVDEAKRLDTEAEAACAAERLVSAEKIAEGLNPPGTLNVPCPPSEPHDPVPDSDCQEALSELARLGQETSIG